MKIKSFVWYWLAMACFVVGLLATAWGWRAAFRPLAPSRTVRSSRPWC